MNKSKFMRSSHTLRFIKGIGLVIACAALLVSTEAQAREHETHNFREGDGYERHHEPVYRDHEREHEHDDWQRRDWQHSDWQRGRWLHGRYEGRNGWWWVVGDTWYYYARPVYPYPYEPQVVYAPPVVVEPPPPPSSGINFIFPLHIK